MAREDAGCTSNVNRTPSSSVYSLSSGNTAHSVYSHSSCVLSTMHWHANVQNARSKQHINELQFKMSSYKNHYTLQNNYHTHTTVLQTLCWSTSVSQHSQLRTKGFFWNKILLLVCLADGKWQIQIREKKLEFSWILLPTPSPHHTQQIINKCCKPL